MSGRRKSDPNYSHRHCPARVVAADANAWADRIRRESEQRKATDRPAPVVIKPKEPRG